MRTLALPLLLVLPLLAATSGAGPSTAHFDALLPELNQRSGALPSTGQTKEQRRQGKALYKCFTTLQKDSFTLAGDLKMAKKVATALEKGYPGDAILVDLVGDALDGLGEEVADGRTILANTINGLVEGGLKRKAAARLARADGLLDRADLEPTGKSRARYLLQAVKQVEKGSALALKGNPAPPGASSMSATVDGSPWQANSNFGTAVFGSADVSEATSAVRKVSMVGRQILPEPGTDPPLPGATRRLEITITGTSADVAPGTYTVGNSDGISVSVLWIEEDAEGASTLFVGTGGSITLATVSPPFGTVSVSGTFGFTVANGLTQETRALASGAFNVKNLPQNTVP